MKSKFLIPVWPHFADLCHEAITSDVTSRPRSCAGNTATEEEGIRPHLRASRRSGGQSHSSKGHSVKFAKPLAVIAFAGVLVLLGEQPASAQVANSASVASVINNFRNWIVGLLVAIATLYLTIGGMRYMLAGGDPGQIERAKSALRSAAIGYAFAALAPILVTMLSSVVGS